MGYSIDALTGRLCCDNCPNYTGVRRVRCPWNYCPAAALCPDCRKVVPYGSRKPANVAKYHPTCEAASASYKAEREREAALLASGAAVRCSALGGRDGRVHVLFKRRDGSREGRYMSHATYDAIPLRTPATIEDYAKLGALEPAPVDFHWNR